jgi:hypothetical protein
MIFCNVVPKKGWCIVLFAIVLTVIQLVGFVYVRITRIYSFLHVVVFACVLIMSGLVVSGFEVLAWKFV